MGPWSSELNVYWKKIGHHSIKCRWSPGCLESMMHNRDAFSVEFAITETDDLVEKSTPIVKFEIQVRDEIEQLMDDDGHVLGDLSLMGYNSADATVTSVSALVSLFSSPIESRKLEKAFSLCRSRHGNTKSSDSTRKEHIQELHMLLEAYFTVIDSTLNKLTSPPSHISSIS